MVKKYRVEELIARLDAVTDWTDPSDSRLHDIHDIMACLRYLNRNLCGRGRICPNGPNCDEDHKA